MHATDQRISDLVPLLQQELDQVSPGLRIEPNPAKNRTGGCWNIVDPATSKKLECFCLNTIHFVQFYASKKVDHYTRSVLKNAIMRMAAGESAEPGSEPQSPTVRPQIAAR
jgi:hypothetical protein